MKKAWLIGAGGVLIIASSVTWWLNSQEAATTGALPPVETPVVDNSPAPVESAQPEVESGVIVGETEEKTSAGVARRLRRVPDTRPANDGPSTDIRDLTAGNIEDLVQANLSTALDGKLESAYFVTQTRRICERFARTPEELDRRIDRNSRRFERDFQRGRDPYGGSNNRLPWSTTGDPETDRANMEDWYAACQRVESMFTPDLRQQFEMLAQAGDIIARYLYASWPLDKLDHGDAFNQQYRWEGLAREFSQANLDMGEVAGLMAFAQSYQNGWFTGRNNDLALAFTIASLNCGFETNASRRFLTNRIEQLSNSDDPADLARLQFAMAEAEQLGSFCAH